MTPQMDRSQTRDGHPPVGTEGFARAVENGIDNTFITWAEQFGKEIKSVSTSQIRNIFGTVKQLEMAGDLNLPQLLLLKPRIAYAMKRHGELRSLGSELTKAVDSVNAGTGEEQQARFRRFCQGFEAILAYHRAAGGK